VHARLHRRYSPLARVRMPAQAPQLHRMQVHACAGTSAPLTMAMQLEEALERQQEGAHRAFTPVLDTLVTVVDAQGWVMWVL